MSVSWVSNMDRATLKALDRILEVMDRVQGLFVWCPRSVVRQPTPETAALVGYELEVSKMLQVSLSRLLTAMSDTAEGVDVLLSEVERLLDRNPKREEQERE